MTRSETGLAALLGFCFAVGLYEVSGYRWQVALGPGMACAFGLGLTLILLVQSARRERAKVTKLVFADVAQFIWLATAVACVIALGFGIGGGIYVTAHLLVSSQSRRRRRVLVAAVCGAIVPVVVFGFFQNILDIRLFSGLLLS